MRSVLLSVALVAALCASADVREARAKFVGENAEPFQRAYVLLYSSAPDATRFDKASGKNVWQVALPYSKDSRLRFIKLTCESGKFVSGEMSVFGRKPAAIGESEFQRLRDEFPMLVVRTGVDEVNPTACLYPAKRTKLSHRPVPNAGLNEDPRGVALGALGGALDNLGVVTSKLTFDVVYRHDDGSSVKIGTATAKNRIDDAAVFKAVRGYLEAKTPARKGQISDRDVLDYRDRCEIVYE